MIYIDTIYEYYLVYKHPNNAWYHKDHILIEKPYLTIIANIMLVSVCEKEEWIQFQYNCRMVQPWSLDRTFQKINCARLPMLSFIDDARVFQILTRSIRLFPIFVKISYRIRWIRWIIYSFHANCYIIQGKFWLYWESVNSFHG